MRRSLTPCLEPGCPELVSTPGRCAAHGGGRRVYNSRAYQAARRIVIGRAKVCVICGKPPTRNDPLTADHVVLVAKGGASTVENLRAVHDSCNKRKGSAHF